jgi:hypothetical protein
MMLEVDLSGFGQAELEELLRGLQRFSVSPAGALVSRALLEASQSALRTVRNVRSEEQAKGAPYANGVLDALEGLSEPGFGLDGQIRAQLARARDEASLASRRDK